MFRFFLQNQHVSGLKCVFVRRLVFSNHTSRFNRLEAELLIAASPHLLS